MINRRRVGKGKKKSLSSVETLLQGIFSVYYFGDLIFTGLVTPSINNNAVPAQQLRAQVLECGCLNKKKEM